MTKESNKSSSRIRFSYFISICYTYIMYAERIGIIRGGETHERERSLELGAAMMHVLEESAYDVEDVFVDEKGGWWKGGVNVDPSRVLDTLSFVIPVFPGVSPVSVRVVTLVEQHGIPYLGASPVVEHAAHHPERRRELLQEHDIHTPRAVSLRAYDAPSAQEVALSIVRAHPLPLRIVSIPSEEYAHIAPALMAIEEVQRTLSEIQSGVRDVFVEEDVQGTHLTVYRMSDFRGEKNYAFPPVLTLDTAFENWSRGEGKDAEDTAKAVADILSLEGFVRVDLTLTPKKIVVRDVRTTPDFTAASPFHRAMESVGATKREVIERIIGVSAGDVA
jgi:D-alanine-D-alanine ligase-like ATP-grasp enzyme